ncbi:CAP domain-containing protein [Russula vinacea]|nr:CAP domain-containing protein [Russula vinacea]
MLSLLFITLFAIASLHGAFGAPSCPHGTTNVDTCASRCKHKLGWPGYAMGSGRWGPVAHKTNENVDGLTIKACNGSTPSSLLLAPSGTAGSNMHSNCSVTGASHAPYTRNPSVLSTSPTGSTAKPTTPPAGRLEDASKSNTTQPTPASSPSVTPSSKPSPTPASTDGSGDVIPADIKAYLDAHNTVRSQHGAADLTWGADLSAYAQSWANKCQFVHSDGSYGENLAAGTGGFTIAAAIGMWAEEASSYDPKNPEYSHFTQMVWKSTTQVGCAYQNCSGIFPASYGLAQFYVCEYSPRGNVIGQFAQNVQA